MENLTTTSSNDQIREKFPLLKSGAVNLNGTKYRTKRVYSTLPIDLKAVASISGWPGSYEDNIGCCRLLAYATGCSARNVERLLKDSSDEGQTVFKSCGGDYVKYSSMVNLLSEVTDNVRKGSEWTINLATNPQMPGSAPAAVITTLAEPGCCSIN
eukprot:scaffold6314_cov273-Ochromonas_danica.AAC.4